MITLNDILPPQQPSGLNENPEKVKTDTHSISGARERNQYPSKKRAVLTFRYAKPETYQFFSALYEAATPVAYFNDDSNVAGGVQSFVGIIDVEEDDYFRGGSLLVPLTVTIREE